MQGARKAPGSKTPFRHHVTKLLSEEIELGVAISRDPANADLPELALRTTTIYSAWYMRTCYCCKHKFRDGDVVRLCPLCERAYHDDNQYRFYCWRQRFANAAVCGAKRYDPIAEAWEVGCPYRWSGRFPEYESATEQLQCRRIAHISTQFLRGIEKVWMPYGQEPLFEVEDGSPIIGYWCQWCRFQIRAGDRVVKCPCGKCNGHFHDDIYRHLTCWNDWNGSQGHDYCPVTGAGIAGTANRDGR
ncbi:MAG TPA: hypothetical protein VFX97_05490 [Pyrinomonadaceae bacterium]|nr:hypothetical protein [Pyrinomonadaceae bacterium]